MTRRFAWLLVAALLALPISACENTGEGIEEDLEENVETLDEEVNEEETE